MQSFAGKISNASNALSRPSFALTGMVGDDALVDYPHPRHACAVFKFDSTNHKQHCPNCWCAPVNLFELGGCTLAPEKHDCRALLYTHFVSKRPFELTEDFSFFSRHLVSALFFFLLCFFSLVAVASIYIYWQVLLLRQTGPVRRLGSALRCQAWSRAVGRDAESHTDGTGW